MHRPEDDQIVSVESFIDRLAEAAHEDLKDQVDQALLSMGFSTQFVNRRRGQLNRWSKVREEQQRSRNDSKFDA